MRFATLLIALFASTQLFAESAPSVSTTEQAAKPAKPKKICRLAEEQSGTRIGSGRICKTEAEWAEFDANPQNRNSRKSTRSVTAD